MRKTKSLLSVLAASTFLGFGGAANAGYFASTITNGNNAYQDQSREAYIDVNQDGLFGIQDVLIGFLRIDDKIAPSGFSLNNQAYAIFSQQVVAGPAGSPPRSVFFAPTTTVGLRLQDLGIPAGPNDMLAVYSKNTPFINLITTSPGNNGTGGAVTLRDYLNYLITNGTLDMVAGIYDTPTCTGGTSDCFTADSLFAGLANSNLIGLNTGVNVATFAAGLEVSTDPAGVVITDTTQSGAFYPNAVPISISELALTQGAASGYFNADHQIEWTNVSELGAGGWTQCLTPNGSVQCGFIDNTTITFNAQVPEPATLALLGVSLLGMGGVMRRRRA